MTPSQTPAFRCECCGTIFTVGNGIPYIDNDLGGPVCADCHTKLKWAHVRLKLSGITPCAQRNERRAA